MKTLIKLIVLLLGVIFLSCCVVANTLTNRYFSRSDRRAYFSMSLTYDDVKADLPRKDLSFYSGPNKLVGVLYENHNPVGLAVVVHGHAATWIHISL